MKIRLILLLMFLGTFQAYSNNIKNESAIIKGIVLDHNNNALAHAAVYIEGTSIGVMADINGVYQIKAPKAKQKLSCSFIGYKDWSREIDVTGNLEITINMESSPLEMEEVVIESKSKSALTKEQGFSMGIIDTRIEALTTLQATDILSRSSGIILQQDGGIGSNINFNINGLSGNSVRVFIDGTPIQNFGSSFSLSSIPTSQIERIEVYKGVVPAHLAEDALGGAINVILKKSQRNTLSSSYSYGSFNTHKVGVDGGYFNPKNGLTATGSAFYNYSDNNYKVWGDEITTTDPLTGKMTKIVAERFHDSYSSLGANAKIGVQGKNWADDLNLGIIYSQMHKDIQHGATAQIAYGNRHSKQNTKLASIQYKKFNILKKIDLDLFTSYSHVNTQVIDTIATMYDWSGNPLIDKNGDIIEWNKGGGEAGRATDAINKDKTVSGTYRANYKFTKGHEVSVNVLLNNLKRDIEDSFLPKLEQDLLDTRTLNKTVYSFAYDGRFIDNKLSVTAFGKWYHQRVALVDPQIEGSVVTPIEIDRKISDWGYGGALSYKLGTETILSVSAEKAMRLPSSSELLGDYSKSIESSYNLRPEQSQNVNLGVNTNIVNRNKHKLNIDISLFYRNVTDLIQKSMTNPTDEMYGYENIGKVLSKGVDFELFYTFNNKLEVRSAISYTDARFNLKYDEYGAEYIYYGDRLRNMPYFTSNINVSYNFFKKLSVNYNFAYVHEFYRDWESLGNVGKDTIPAQLVHSVGATYKLNKHFSFSGQINNVFNEQVYDNWALQKPGRAFYGKITYKF